MFERIFLSNDNETPNLLINKNNFHLRKCKNNFSHVAVVKRISYIAVTAVETHHQYNENDG